MTHILRSALAFKLTMWCTCCSTSIVRAELFDYLIHRLPSQHALFFSPACMHMFSCWRFQCLNSAEWCPRCPRDSASKWNTFSGVRIQLTLHGLNCAQLFGGSDLTYSLANHLLVCLLNCGSRRIGAATINKNHR